MTKYELYVRLLTELSYYARATDITRTHLQDVLCEMRRMAHEERGGTMQDVQEQAESEALQTRLRQR